MNGKQPPDNNILRDVETLKVPMSLKNGRTLRFRLLPLVQYDHLAPSSKERVYWDIQEGYMQLQWLPWTIQIGQNVQTWGDTDVFNPLDVVNAKRYYDPLHSEKLGAGTLLVKYEKEAFQFQALYIPKQRETKIPGESSRWLPRDVYKSRTYEGVELGNATLSGKLNLPTSINYSFADPLILDKALDNNIGALMKFRLPGFDWTIAGFQGASITPAVNLRQVSITSVIPATATTNLDVSVGPNITLRASYYKIRMLGTSFVWVLGDFLLKGASAHTEILSKVTDDTLPKNTLENALGLERTFSLGSGSLTTLLQGTYIKREERLDSNSISLARMFDRAGMVGLRWAPTERLTVLASLLHDFHYRGDLQHGELGYKIADGWSTKLAGDFLSGTAETPLGTYKRNSRIYLSINLQK